MRSTRTTVLMTEDERAALDSFAAGRGQSVGNVVREATAKYMAQEHDTEAEVEAELSALTAELEDAIPQMREDIEAMRQAIREARQAVAAYRSEKDAGRKAAA